MSGASEPIAPPLRRLFDAAARPLSRLAAVGGRTRISLLACLFALVLAGCGSDGGTIPENQSSDLLSLLDNVQSNAQSGDCDTASGFAQEFANRVDELPSDVDADVRDELDKAANNLDQLASDSNQCNAPEAGATRRGRLRADHPEQLDGRGDHQHDHHRGA